MSWTKKQLGDLATIQLGKMLDQKKNQGDYLPYLGNDNIQWNELKLDEVKQMRIRPEERERFRLQPNDILVCEGGDPGRCALWTSSEEMYYQKALHRVRVGKELDPRFLLYYLIHLGNTQAIRQYYTGSSTIKHLPNAAIKRVLISYPSIEKQKKIAEILSVYDSLIENNRKQIKLLEEAAQRLYKEWFVDLHFPGHETAPINLETGLPEGWVSQKLYEAVNVIRGVSYTSDTLSTAKGKRLLNLGNLMPYGGFRDGYEKYYLGKFGEHHVLSGGDIVLGLTEQAEGLAGYAARIPSYLKGSLFSADLALLQPLQLSSEYLYASLRYGNISRTLSPFASGAKIKHLKPDHLRGVEIVVADEATVKSFSETARLLLSKQDVCRQAINRLREARDRLLPKLMEACND